MIMDSLSLLELNALVRRSLEQCLPDEYWIQAELSDVRSNTTGHCYLEFIQKDPRSNSLVAKARGMIWNNIYRLLKPYFEESTGQLFTSGIKVLVKVTVQFHELYGYSLTVLDIDPTYTLGDMARRRREILLQLEEEGVLTLNKELEMPVLPQRIAVVSSATAAGYGDFCHQLKHNSGGFFFYTELFPALMQGNQVEESVLAALDCINTRISEFDVVVIIRGGGAASDLSGFDTYLLAAACAQFPLPVITGIGHERDDTVLDSVAHTRVKTPTAAAELLIQRVGEAAERLEEFYANDVINYQKYVEEKQALEEKRFDAVAQKNAEEYSAWQKDADAWQELRSTYDDWDKYGDSEEDFLKRKIDRVKEFYNAGKISFEEFIDDTNKYSMELYKSQSSAVDELLQKQQDYISNIKDEFSKQEQELRDSWDVADRKTDMSEVQAQLDVYANSVTDKGQQKYKELQEQMKQLQRDEELYQLQKKNNATIESLEAEYKQMEDGKKNILTGLQNADINISAYVATITDKVSATGGNIESLLSRMLDKFDSFKIENNSTFTHGTSPSISNIGSNSIFLNASVIIAVKTISIYVFVVF